MIPLAELIFGPLLIPECRRAVARGWIILVRGLAALAAALVVLSVLWWWWISLDYDPNYLPYEALRIGLATLEGIGVVIALLISPSLLAGSLAGDKERGTLGLLLTASVNSWEIVAGRLSGKLAQICMILLAGVPVWFLLAALAGIRVPALLGMIGLPAALVIGSSGVTMAASAVARRGRDALFAVFLGGFVLLPLLLTAATRYLGAVGEWIIPISPFYGIRVLVWNEDPAPAALTMMLWLIMGISGLGVAAWRLRPSCLRLLSGEERNRRRRRRWVVPPVDDVRPMLWKEMFIERVSPLGRFGKWAGIVIFLALIAVSTGYGAMVVYNTWWRAQPHEPGGFADQIGAAIADSAPLVAYLIELSIALRAAVAITSERERSTWDGLLTSPLEAREIVLAKLCGSFYALRWLILAALWAWILALLFEAMTIKTFGILLLEVVVIGTCMSAIGVRISMAALTGTRAMSIAVGLWLVALCSFWLFALILVGTLALAIQMFWWSFYGFIPPPGLASPFAWVPISFSDAWTATMLGLYVVLSVLVVIESRYRFDRIAGRMTGGEVEVAVDQFLHGVPMEPVPLNGVPMSKSMSADDPALIEPSAVH
jgi:ABC-type transport system involved in multi-copper enzyme maturation permease subunit